MPPADVYLVLPAFMAAVAACLMFSGVSKSGSPAPKSQTLTPAARKACAACIAAIVTDDCMRLTFLETGNDDIAGQVFICGLTYPSSFFRPEAARVLQRFHPTETLL